MGPVLEINKRVHQAVSWKPHIKRDVGWWLWQKCGKSKNKMKVKETYIIWTLYNIPRSKLRLCRQPCYDDDDNNNNNNNKITSAQSVFTTRVLHLLCIVLPSVFITSNCTDVSTQRLLFLISIGPTWSSSIKNGWCRSAHRHLQPATDMRPTSTIVLENIKLFAMPFVFFQSKYNSEQTTLRKEGRANTPFSYWICFYSNKRPDDINEWMWRHSDIMSLNLTIVSLLRYTFRHAWNATIDYGSSCCLPKPDTTFAGMDYSGIVWKMYYGLVGYCR